MQRAEEAEAEFDAAALTIEATGMSKLRKTILVLARDSWAHPGAFCCLLLLLLLLVIHPAGTNTPSSCQASLWSQRRPVPAGGPRFLAGLASAPL